MANPELDSAKITEAQDVVARFMVEQAASSDELHADAPIGLVYLIMMSQLRIEQLPADQRPTLHDEMAAALQRAGEDEAVAERHATNYGKRQLVRLHWPKHTQRPGSFRPQFFVEDAISRFGEVSEES